MEYIKHDDNEKIDSFSSYWTNTLQMSNLWVIHGNYTNVNKPILANDAHFEKQMPGVFFLAILKFPDGNILEGGTISGIPIVFIGRNRDLSWGISGNSIENIDVVEIELNEERTHYRCKDKVLPMLETKKELIKIKNSESIEHISYNTIYGPLIKPLQNVKPIKIPTYYNF